MFKKLREPVSDVAELTEQQEYIGTVEGDIAKMKIQIDENIKLCDMLEEKYSYKLNKEITEARWNMFSAPGDVMKVMEEVTETLRVQRLDLLCEQNDEQVSLGVSVEFTPLHFTSLHLVE